MGILDEISKGEGKTLEFKKELPEKKRIAKTAVAFANTSGGKIVIGVDNDLNVIGLNSDEDIFALKDRITNIIHDNCKPDIVPEIYTKNIGNKIILIIEIYRGSSMPYYLKGRGNTEGTYIRVGATNKKAGPEKYQDLVRQSVNVTYDEDINYDISIDDINISLLAEKFDSVDKKLNDSKMKTLGLIVEKEGKSYPSNGLLVLLGYYEHCKVMCSRFKGDKMSEFLDRKEYDGDLFSQLENTEIFIKNHIRLETEISGLQRKERFEIPEAAIRESLINALVHRDYSSTGRNIKVAVYDSSVNIVSPGGLPNTITQQDILDGRSEIRNRVIAKVFKELGYIEMWGSGINRIIESCKDQNLKTPVIKEKNDFFNVILFRENAENSIENNLNIDLNKLKILKYMKEHNERIVTKEAIEILSLKERRVREILSGMCQEKMIRRVDKGPKTYYTNQKSVNLS